MAKSARQPRAAELSVRIMAPAVAQRRVPTPRLRAKVTRAGLPLQMVQRMKFGCA